MNSNHIARLAAVLLVGLVTEQSQAMDVAAIKGKDGKDYFCANAKCAGNSECAGAGNPQCGAMNKCSNTEQGYLTGWLGANDQAQCEAEGRGKWLAFKKEYSVAGGNKPPLKPAAGKSSPKQKKKTPA